MNKFPLGSTYMTKGVSSFVKENDLDKELNIIMNRHATGDWGNLSEEDKQANEEALEHGDRLLSSYELGGKKIWVISEWDRSVTTVLFPDEY